MGKTRRKTGNKRTKLNPKTTNEDNTSTSEGDDRLSSLPDAILTDILSLLPTKTAISTSVLSRRWRNLCTHLSLLSFTGPRLPSYPESENPGPEFLPQFEAFLTTVDNVLCRLISPKIVKFELIIDLPKNYDSDRCNSLVNSWVRRVCSRQPQDITVNYQYWNNGKPLANMPPCVFQCNSIVFLNLGHGLVYDLPEDIYTSLHNLKKLEMVITDSHQKLLQTLFKGCPLLEELSLRTKFDEKGHVVEVCCPNLKSFALCGQAFARSAEFVIDAPELENLLLSSYCTWYRFVRTPLKLDKAEFTMVFDECCCSYEENDFPDQILGVVEAIRSVSFFKMFGLFFTYINGKEEDMPVFHNLIELEVEDFFFERSEGLLFFLSSCPNLEVLVLCRHTEYLLDGRWTVPDFKPACLFTTLKILELNCVDECNYHLDFMEYMLRNGSVLEKLLVSVQGPRYNPLGEEFEFCHKLFSYPRSSSVCEIKFFGHSITASSKGFKNGVLDCQIRHWSSTAGSSACAP